MEPQTPTVIVTRPESMAERIAREEHESQARRQRESLDAKISIIADRLRHITPRRDDLAQWVTFLETIRHEDQQTLNAVMEALANGAPDANTRGMWEDQRRTLRDSVAAVAVGPWDDVIDLEDRAAKAGLIKHGQRYTSQRFHLDATQRRLTELQSELQELIILKAQLEVERALLNDEPTSS